MAWTDPTHYLPEPDRLALEKTLVCWLCGATNVPVRTIQLTPDGTAICAMCDNAWQAWTWVPPVSRG
jgi:transcription elongation factor Elf1